MNIEFHTPYGKASEKLVSYLKNEILKLSHVYKDIVRADVFLKEDETIIPSENKVCEIRLTIFADDILAHARTEKFEKSSKEAIKELRKMVRQQVKKQNEPPDEIISTVDV